MNNNIINVHNMNCDEAIKAIKDAIQTSYRYGWQVLYVIHGFNKGNKIKDKIRQTKFDHVSEIREDIQNPGRTIFYIKLKIF